MLSELLRIIAGNKWARLGWEDGEDEEAATGDEDEVAKGDNSTVTSSSAIAACYQKASPCIGTKQRGCFSSRTVSLCSADSSNLPEWKAVVSIVCLGGD
ncbi:hypothetical protein MHU86_6379 [Fragilaria crotonensis]|nr:hypothetical protein MHU86_6379 [Fragilaria crotonensis]